MAVAVFVLDTTAGMARGDYDVARRQFEAALIDAHPLPRSPAGYADKRARRLPSCAHPFVGTGLWAAPEALLARLEQARIQAQAQA
ncbi:MAG: hypothetical protein M1826_000821 [Phylliscum demangeonii]|nr:MAG: hypothetical protein M1826_000821 [Phylliscum demangeonii]